MQAVGEAWDWLFFRGLIARQAGTREDQQLYVTPQGERVVRDPRGLEILKAEARLDLPLHHRIDRRVRRQFLLGEYELAAFAAMREVEIRIGDLLERKDLLGVALAKEALKPGGPLADRNLHPAEEEGLMALFWGALAVFKNPRAIVRSSSTIRPLRPRSSSSPTCSCGSSTGSKAKSYVPNKKSPRMSRQQRLRPSSRGQSAEVADKIGVEEGATGLVTPSSREALHQPRVATRRPQRRRSRSARTCGSRRSPPCGN